MGKNEILTPEVTPLDRFDPGPALAPFRLAEHVGVLVRHRLFIALVTLSVAALGVLYALARPPSYTANLLIHVTDMRSSEPRTLLGDTTPGMAYKRAMSEAELLRSRSVIGAAATRLRLDLVAEPRRFPLVGAALARWNAGRGAAPAPYGGYAWGGERIRVGELSVPPELLDQPFHVTRLDGERYSLHAADGRPVGVGRVGEPLLAALDGASVRLTIDAMEGAPGTAYLVARRPVPAVIEEIGDALNVAELGKDTGVLSVRLEGAEPRRVTAVLNEIGNVYMEHVRLQKANESTGSMEVLRARLPALRERLAAAEERYESYRRQHGAADVVEDTRLALGRLSATREQLSQLQRRRAELGVRYGDRHPELLALEQQLEGARREIAGLEAETGRLPAVATELERLARDLKAETDLYNAVLRRLEELDVDAGDRSSNVRIVDEAVVPARPTGSRKAIVALSVVLGLCFGIGGAFFLTLRERLRQPSRGEA
ncbi:uncharacterized protein involved in exopolysaccharide biosynthesis [Massilia sp. UYP11]|uniref:GNVR domain-containing protein n=1 Tax=Massilia sp. UYP11 TaxID=1756385 RepID=UPI003D22CD55